VIETFSGNDRMLHAWCVLPNHWHALVRTDDLKLLLKEIGQLHGRASFQWNQEDDARGRKCWHRCADRRIRTDRHYYVAGNYIHHNPVKHGYVGKWEEWPYSSAGDYIAEAGRETVLKQWKEYPILDMGEGWDD
jgi:putative transposase